MLSATLDGDAGRLAEEYTKDARRHEHETTEQTKGEIEHRFVRVPHDAKHSVLMKELDEERDLALVFVRTKHGADRLAKRLTRDGVKAVAIHGNRTQAQREKALSSFERGDVDTLVATDVAARGIDVRGVSHVINFDAPPAREDYVHQIGRAHV